VHILGYSNSLTVPKGCVISQTPEAGSELERGKTISLVISSGKADILVTLNAGEGPVEQETVIVHEGDPYGESGELPVPIRTGYRFGGWYEDTEWNEESRVESGTTVQNAQNHVLYAKWDAESYTVTLDVNGGNALPEGETQVTVTYDAAFGKLPTATRTGYGFDGWYTAKDGGTEITEGTVYADLTVTTLYAHWSAGSVTVTFNGNGGADKGSRAVTYEGTYGDLPTSTREGYVFVGWYTAPTAGELITRESKVTDNQPHTLYAHWTEAEYTVTFDANGGKVTKTTGSVTYNRVYGTLPTPTWEGHTFRGWYTDKEAGSRVTAQTVCATAKDHTLYARWTLAQVTVTFDGNGGTVAAADSTKAVTYNSTYGDLPTPTWSGHTFDGWYTEKSGGTKVTKDTKVTVSTAHTLYAHWTALSQYTISYDANGGSGAPAAQTKTHGQALTLSSTKPTRTGYTFNGWATTKGSSTVAYNPGASYTGNADLTLYAVWTALPTYTVSYDANGGSGAPAAQTKKQGEALTLSSTKPTRSGYTFSGWATTKGSSTATYQAGASYTGNADLTLYAVWTA
ncbi:MAG: InlB B-repeat-containing protein, partial [Lachnospiraceae bacterium]|nr:InlB B-repeat-containing protein [Lachnospiraceae bacterium]